MFLIPVGAPSYQLQYLKLKTAEQSCAFLWTCLFSSHTQDRENYRSVMFFLLILKMFCFEKCLLVLQVLDVAVYKPNRLMTQALAEFQLIVTAAGTVKVCTHTISYHCKSESYS